MHVCVTSVNGKFIVQESKVFMPLETVKHQTLGLLGLIEHLLCTLSESIDLTVNFCSRKEVLFFSHTQGLAQLSCEKKVQLSVDSQPIGQHVIIVSLRMGVMGPDALCVCVCVRALPLACSLFGVQELRLVYIVDGAAVVMQLKHHA